MFFSFHYVPHPMRSNIILLENNIGEKGIKYLGKEISKCVTLTSFKIDIFQNIIGQNGTKYLGKGISKCVSITSLDLNFRLKIIGENSAKY